MKTQKKEIFSNRYSGTFVKKNIWSWFWQRRRDRLPPPPKKALATIPADLPFLQHNRYQTAVTWIGHATILMQLAGKNILLDPVFSDRASPISCLGPKRWQSPGVSIHDLPHIDLVLISHNHYDHLDLRSVRTLMKQKTGAPLFCVPAGIDQWFIKNIKGSIIHGKEKNIFSFHWDEVYDLLGLKIEFLAVQHWSKRTPWDTNHTLWGSWAVTVPNFCFWFSGDLGYSQDIVDIAKKYPNIDLAMIGIGAYEPRWLMQPHHLNPEEAVMVFQTLKAKKAMAMHWGTFPLTDEALDAPLDALEEARKKYGITKDEFFVLAHGETRVFN